MIGLTEAMNGGQPLRLLDLAFFPMLFHRGGWVGGRAGEHGGGGVEEQESYRAHAFFMW